ncbi:hypothetical protein E2P81_ATG04056 [Venturia nashicola]|uniref:PHD-type domain-containing protein n=1 Tax=Venturia nashicola TaxID=86259 RepID=A0A4Z1PHF3_9PEZI|nr:hypothetical protein E6O75_ATG04156 [Venturia nashicola]TLD37244.1 hypothetical protein E2P81_ATG04056 [Venturia nashicola]
MSLQNSADANNGNHDSLDPSFALGASDNDTTSFFNRQFSPTAPNNNVNPLTNGPPSHQYLPAAPPQAQQAPTGFSAQTAAILARAKQNIANHTGSASYEAAREQLMKGMVTSDQLPVPASSNTPKRGRGGRGRGGRPGGAARSPTAGDGSTPGSTSTPASERGRGKVGRPRGRGRGGGRGGKRKRSESLELSDVHSTPEPETDFKSNQGDDDDDVSDVSESYTPLPAKTKSGRAVNKPTQYVPVIPEAKPEGKKRRPYRRNIEAAVCKMCNRGTSPSSNQIVFCDGCGTPYHQYCHDPPIETDVVEIPDKEWFCSTCVKSKESAEVPNEEGLVTGDGLSADEKRARLSTLPQSRLLELLIQASSIHPDLALFPASATLKPEAAPTAPVETTASGGGGLDIDGEEDANAEPYDGYDTDPPSHYPKAGNGVARTLRPETEDLQWLVDENVEVFSHETNYLSPSETNGNGNGVGGVDDTKVKVGKSTTERQKTVDSDLIDPDGKGPDLLGPDPPSDHAAGIPKAAEVYKK